MNKHSVRQGLLSCCFLSILLLSHFASASVIMVGTRVVYPSNIKAKTIQLVNQDNFFNVVQMWADVNNPDSTPDSADAPFLITPPVFRMEAGKGQDVRLIYTGQGLPQDRESIFYLNMLQIPPTLAAAKDKSQLKVLLRHRLKIFYRPTGIAGRIEDLPTTQTFNVAQKGKDLLLTVTNPTGYFATFRRVELVAGSKVVTVEVPMVKPHSSEVVTVKKAVLPAGPIKVNFALVSDQGGDNAGSFVVHR